MSNCYADDWRIIMNYVQDLENNRITRDIFTGCLIYMLSNSDRTHSIHENIALLPKIERVREELFCTLSVGKVIYAGGDDFLGVIYFPYISGSTIRAKLYRFIK